MNQYEIQFFFQKALHRMITYQLNFMDQKIMIYYYKLNEVLDRLISAHSTFGISYLITL